MSQLFGTAHTFLLDYFIGIPVMCYNIALLGGDARFRALAAMLREDPGFRVRTFGLFSSGTEETDLFSCMADAEIIVAPIPFSKDNVYINAPYAMQPIEIAKIGEAAAGICGQPGKQRLFISGTIPEALKETLVKAGVCCIDLTQRDDYAILNAIPTGEGVLQAVMEELPVTVFGLNALVLGAGRVGRVTAKQLKALGAQVTIALRSGRDRAWAFSEGFAVCGYGEDFHDAICRAGLIVNTVPAPVLSETEISKTKKECLMIDVASGAGGIDFAAAEQYGRTAKHLLALPGKVAPDSAASYIKCVMENIIAENLKGCY